MSSSHYTVAVFVPFLWYVSHSGKQPLHHTFHAWLRH